MLSRLREEKTEEYVHRLSVAHQRLSTESSEQRDHRLSVIHKHLANESDEQRKHRVGLIHECLVNEHSQDRSLRLSAMRIRNREARLNVNEEQRSQRLEIARSTAQKFRTMDESKFFININ